MWTPGRPRHSSTSSDDDAWEAILAQPGWTVRILTKNAAVTRDFDLIERYRDRVLVGLSTTGTAEAGPVLATIDFREEHWIDLTGSAGDNTGVV